MTIPKNDQIEQRLMAKDLLATYYAWGRLDQGHPPVMSLNDEPPNTSATAWHFGVLYRAMESAMAYEITCFSYGVQSAWDHFVETKGRTVLTPRDEVCKHPGEPRPWEGDDWCSRCGANLSESKEAASA